MKSNKDLICKDDLIKFMLDNDPFYNGKLI